MDKPNKQPSKLKDIRRGFVMPPPPKFDPLTPAERLAEHKASKAHRGPDAGGRVRVALRNKMGGEKGAEAPLVRSMYDLTTKRRRRRKRNAK